MKRTASDHTFSIMNSTAGRSRRRCRRCDN